MRYLNFYRFLLLPVTVAAIACSASDPVSSPPTGSDNNNNNNGSSGNSNLNGSGSGGSNQSNNNGGSSVTNPSGSGGSSSGSGGSNNQSGGNAGSTMTMGGGAGTTTTGGGKAPPCTGMEADLIADLENGSPTLAYNCRNGSFYTYNDGTGTQMPVQGTAFTPETITPARMTGDGGVSNKGAHTKGSGFKTWGAGMGLNLTVNGTVKAVYDASKWTGVTFWAKGPGTVRFMVPIAATDPTGGICTPATMCNDHFAVDLVLTGDWKQFTVKWSELLQLGMFGTAATFDAKTIYGFEWQVAGTATMPATFDFWVDDLSFVK